MASIHILTLEARRSGGAATYSAELVRQLASRGHRVSLICHEAEPELEKVSEIHRLPPSKADQLPWAWRLAVLLRQRDYNRAIRALPLDRPDFVIGSAQQMIPEHQRRFPGVPLIYVPHSLIAPFEVQTMPRPSLLQRWVSAGVFHYLELRALNQARSTIRFTRAGCEALMAYYGKSIKPRFVVLPTPVPIPNLPGDFDGINSKRHPHLRLLYVGRLVESKNVAWLLRCLNRLNHLSWTCDIVGDGEERPHLEKLTLQRGLENRIVFHGHQDDVGSFYRQADLLIFPSRLENSPIVLLEAMSFGVPSLSIRADGQRYINANHEIITAGHDGFLADGEEQFVQKLQELLISPDCLKTVGRNARQTVEKRHRWLDHIRGYERIFEEITGTSGRPSRNEETQPCLR